jgi:hypothetical protein
VSEDLKAHWEHIFRTKAPDAVSWFEPVPEVSLQLIGKCVAALQANNPQPPYHLLEVGTGNSAHAQHLLLRLPGQLELTLLDISGEALRRTEAQLGQQPNVQYVEDSILTANLPQPVHLWHDRAVLHFFTEPEQQAQYAAQLKRCVAPGGYVMLGGFAPTGPEKCSGLPVFRHTESSLTKLVGSAFSVVQFLAYSHPTPFATQQDFLFGVFRRET